MNWENFPEEEWSDKKKKKKKGGEILKKCGKTGEGLSLVSGAEKDRY